MTARPVVLIAEELAPSVLAVLGDGFEVRHVDGADRAALLPALADADAVGVGLSEAALVHAPTSRDRTRSDAICMASGVPGGPCAVHRIAIAPSHWC